MSNEAVSISTEALLQLAEGERDHYLRRALEAESQNQALQEALVRCCEIQPKVLTMLRREGFKFETPLHLSEGWEKLAFTLYATVCEADSIARNALSPTQETDPG
jgi:hypothetical protein